jgi:uncharacterized protein (TIGR03435 family)
MEPINGVVLRRSDCHNRGMLSVTVSHQFSVLRYWKPACAICMVGAGLAQAQADASREGKFEVASIRRCSSDSAPGDRSGGNVGEPSPAILNLNCQTVIGLIRMAFVVFANGHLNPNARVPILGGPGWIESERYRVNANAVGAQKQETMRGPMMQALLQDRFKLKMHREAQKASVLTLTIAKGGPKLQKWPEGSCVPMDFTKFPPEPPQNMCLSRASPDGPNVMIEAQGITVAEFFGRFFANGIDGQPIVDKTGVSGLFNFRLTYAPVGSSDVSPPGEQAGPSIFTALQQQLGLPGLSWCEGDFATATAVYMQYSFAQRRTWASVWESITATWHIPVTRLNQQNAGSRDGGRCPDMSAGAFESVAINYSSSRAMRTATI